MKKKIGVLLFVLSIMFVLVGWGKEVKLLDGGKLIDLDKAIGLAKPGGMAGNSEDGSKESSDNEEASEAEDNTKQDSLNEEAGNIVIRIRGEKIYYTCGNKKSDNISTAQLENKIRSDYASGTQVTLVDDYAESHVYKDVLEVLNGLKNDIGLSYEADQYAGGSDL